MLNWLDVAVVIILAFFVFHGSQRGLVRTLLDCLAVLLAIFAASQIYKMLSTGIMPALRSPDKVPYVITFAALWLALYLALDLLISALQKFVKVSFIPVVENLLGGLLGFVKGILIVGIFIQLATLSPFPVDLSNTIDASAAKRLTLPTLRQTYTSVFGMFPKIDFFIEKQIIPAIPKK